MVVHVHDGDAASHVENSDAANHDGNTDDNREQERLLEIEMDEDGEDIHMDSILGVTPVNTQEEDDEGPRALGSTESPLFSSLSKESGGSLLNTTPSQSAAYNHDAFSSSSGDTDDDNESVEDSESEEERSKPSQQQQQQQQQLPQSEWDKALMTGKQSKGRASDFFVAQQRLLSTDNSEFYSNSQTARATTPAEQHAFLSPIQSKTNPQYQQQPDVSSSVAQPTKTTAALPPPRPQARSNASPPQTTTQQTTTLNAETRPSGRGSTVVHVQANTNENYPQLNMQRSASAATASSASTATTSTTMATPTMRPQDYYASEGDLSAGVLPDMLMTMRQKIESMTMFDSDILRMTADQVANGDNGDPMFQESRESLKRSSQQSISAAVLVSLAHKRYERRRLAAMEIEKVVRSLVVLQHQTNKQTKNELDRVRAILLLLSDDYVRSTSEDARKGGVVALAACAIGLKKANDHDPTVQECRDLILASVVHACQDHSQRVRYYATESLFNVVKVIPSLAVQHFFILFEVLRSLFADVDSDVRSGAELLDKKLKEVIVGAMNAGIFTAEQCVPVFARFVYMRNKATKRLTLTWLQELNEKLIGAPILEFLHLFLGGVIEMVADPSVAIRQSALAFLQSVLPKLLVVNSEAIDDMDDEGMKVDFDKILQSLVTTMEHANPFVRKVAMYWVSRIVKAHMTVGDESGVSSPRMIAPDGSFSPIKRSSTQDSADVKEKKLSTASISVRNSVPHVLPGILLSVGDNFVSTTTKDVFLPDQTTRSLAEQTNACLQNAVRRDGQAYVEHLDGFIVALREEMASPGGFSSKNPPAVERTPYRMDVLQDGTGIETAGWFRSSRDVTERSDETMVMSRLCALHWVIVLYESVVPDALKADYAREFVFAIIHQLADNPPETIVFKSLEVLAKITVPVSGEEPARAKSAKALPGLGSPAWSASGSTDFEEMEFPMNDSSVEYAMKTLDHARQRLKSRDREVFSALIQLHSDNVELLADLSNVVTYMCKLQPPEFVMVSFAVELHRFIKRTSSTRSGEQSDTPRPRDLRFVSSCIQHMNHVLFNTEEARELRDALKDCIAAKGDTEEHRQRSRLFHILLHSFSHNIAATLSLCLWAGAYRTAFLLLSRIDPMDINLIFLLEIDRLVEMLERPLFRHLHIRILERDQKATDEGSGVMLFQLLKSLLMILPQSTCYRVLRDRLVSVSRFRQSTIPGPNRKSLADKRAKKLTADTKNFVTRALFVRDLHCTATWQTIRQESLEMPKRVRESVPDEGADRRSWLGYASKQEQLDAEKAFREEKKQGGFVEEVNQKYHELGSSDDVAARLQPLVRNEDDDDDGTARSSHEASEEGRDSEHQWKQFWSAADK